jgi:glycosyltransferase involved in cell wall biosynthesis
LAAGGGPAIVAKAIRRFLAGEPEDRELIIVDDGDNPVRDLVPDDPRIRYLRLAEPHSLGAQRNIGCAQAWGEVIEHWDGAGVTLRHRRREWELQPFTP